MLEVERPKHRRRSSRRNLQKSDPSDAERAARAVLAGEASGVPKKSADGRVEMIRALRAARRSAMKARTQAANQLQALPRDGSGAASPPFARALDEGARLGGRTLPPRRWPSWRARGYQVRAAFGGPPLRGALGGDSRALDAHLGRLVAQVAPEELVTLPGIGTDNGATLLIVAGDNPQRLGSEASFADLWAGSLPSTPPPARW